MCGRQVDGRLEDSPLADLDRAGQLTGAVQDRCSGGHGPLEEVGDRPREDCGDAGPGDGVLSPDRDVADPDARHVRDRVARPGLELADAQAVVAEGLAHRPTI